MTIIWHEGEQRMCRCLDDIGRAVDGCTDFTDGWNWLFPNASMLLQSDCGVVA